MVTATLVGAAIRWGMVAAVMSMKALGGDVPFMFREYVRKE